jgi:hypothetical protein
LDPVLQRVLKRAIEGVDHKAQGALHPTKVIFELCLQGQVLDSALVGCHQLEQEKEKVTFMLRLIGESGKAYGLNIKDHADLLLSQLA